MKLNYEEIFKNGNFGCIQVDGETEPRKAVRSDG